MEETTDFDGECQPMRNNVGCSTMSGKLSTTSQCLQLFGHFLLYIKGQNLEIIFQIVLHFPLKTGLYSRHPTMDFKSLIH